MLVKSLQKNEIIFSDAHCHLVNCRELNCDQRPKNWLGATTILSIEEWNKAVFDFDLFYTFGIHPQAVCKENKEEIVKTLDFLEKLLQEKNNPQSGNKKIAAIGEVGFDYFTQEFKENAAFQEEIFNNQIDLALKYNIPLVIHCRKANHKLFEYSSKLKKLPAVLFHSFMGSPVEANSLIKKGIKAYFSFGKQIMNNNKKVIACVKELALENLLLESDAPYQTLKGEEVTKISDIQKIYQEAYKLREDKISYKDFSNILFENLLYLYHE
ncbi:MAG: TatD family hydrolase [Treponema sp.]|nr:TatD family hydrolase [Treponema sp.]